MKDPASQPAPSARGFSTRAIRAASRIPRPGQTPTSVPIYQTATFASADADELGRVAGDPRAGFAYSRIANPTTGALGAAYAELAGGEAGVALASGMGAIYAALASQAPGGRPDRGARGGLRLDTDPAARDVRRASASRSTSST